MIKRATADEPLYAKDDDKLFRSDIDDVRNTAILNFLDDRFPLYADGYKTGADVLVNTCVANYNRGNLDTLIYPAVFLYRQYIELKLKEIIKGLRYCSGADATYPKNHKIENLWSVMKALYLALDSESTKDFANTERLINELACIDNDSMAFRYPEHMNRKTSHSEKINIRNLGEVMNRIASLMDAMSSQVADWVDIESDKRQSLT